MSDDIFGDDVPDEVKQPAPDSIEGDLERYAGWFARKMMLLDAEEQRIKNQAESLLKQIRTSRDSIRARHGRKLLDMMLNAGTVKGRHSKVITVYGTVFAMNIPGRVVTDADSEDAVAEWAKEHNPESVKQVIKIDKRALIKAVNAHFKDSGEVPAGFSYAQPTTRICVRHAGDSAPEVEIE